MALSIKLLISLLHAISNDTLPISIYESPELWVPWFSTFVSRGASVASKLLRLKSLSWRFTVFLKKEYPDDHLLSMKEHEVRRYLNDHPDKLQPCPPGELKRGRAASHIFNQFIENGWCPFRAMQLCKSHDYLVLNSLASLKRHSTAVENHSQCSELQRCFAHNVAVDRSNSYPFHHDHEDVDYCELLEVSNDQISNIIISGGVPLISISREGDLDLKVVRWTPYLCYSAISHVWSDGRGNPFSNAMPRCQLLKLRQVIIQSYSAESSPLYDSGSKLRSFLHWKIWGTKGSNRPYASIDKRRVNFWIDTLCIPVAGSSRSAQENSNLKLRAIRHIAPIYASASTTITIDKGLQSTRLLKPNLIYGDEFAALILSSNWMVRGWTLEEGSLSSGAVFDIKGRPYQMLGTLNHLAPRLQEDHSPLERASLQARQSLVFNLKRALLQDRKQLLDIPGASKMSTWASRVRIPQFVWAWNSLLERSTTKPFDAPIILASLLDFKVTGLKDVPREQMLQMLIQNCDELPLSLLYNKGPRLSIQGHPELSWVPTRIAGDRLVSGAALRRAASVVTNRQVIYYIDRRGCNPASTLVLATPAGQLIPENVDIFRIKVPRGRHSAAVQEYIIQVHQVPVTASDNVFSGRDHGQAQTEAESTYLVLDMACGTSSKRGYSGRGAILHVHSSTSRTTNLEYRAPTTIWTAAQWHHQDRAQEIAHEYSELEPVESARRLLLKFGKLLWAAPIAYSLCIWKTLNSDTNILCRQISLESTIRTTANNHQSQSHWQRNRSCYHALSSLALSICSGIYLGGSTGRTWTASTRTSL